MRQSLEETASAPRAGDQSVDVEAFLYWFKAVFRVHTFSSLRANQVAMHKPSRVRKRNRHSRPSNETPGTEKVAVPACPV